MNHVDHEHERCATTLTRFMRSRTACRQSRYAATRLDNFLARKREREYRAAGPQKSGLFACGMGSTS
jgi:hypothetical protein